MVRIMRCEWPPVKSLIRPLLGSGDSLVSADREWVGGDDRVFSC